MASFLLKGLAGKKNLKGSLSVRGAKNSVLKAQAATLLFDDEVLINNVPLLEDVSKMNETLESLGLEITKEGERSFRFKIPRELDTNINGEIAKKFRASIVLSGPLLAKGGRVAFPHPGGCVIGKRPIDIFLDSFQKMGAKLESREEEYILEADQLKGAEIFFRIPSVTATETLMMAATLADGRSIFHNCACEPEIKSLAEFLNKAGAKIQGAGTQTIIIDGVPRGTFKKGTFDTPPDRIEAGSFLVLAALCGDGLKIEKCCPGDLGAVLNALEEMGVNLKIGEDTIELDTKNGLRSVDIKTREYPGFPTDLQAPFSVLLTQARGKSFIFETVFGGRLNYLNDLERMGADVTVCDPHRAIVYGPADLRGREMESPDLRAGLAFLTAALLAEGESIIHNVYNIDRGYEKIEERLNAVGADIKRIGNKNQNANINLSGQENRNY